MTQSRSRFRIAFVAVASVAALVAACKPGGQGAQGSTGGLFSPPPPPKIVAFLADPVRAESFGAMQRLFPADYERIKAELDAMFKAGKSDDDVRARAFALFKEFGKAHVASTTAAPTAQLVSLAQKQRDFMAALAQDNAEACARLVRNKLENDAGLSAATLTAMSAASAAQIEATRAGMDAPVTRSGQMDDATASAFMEAISAQKVREEAMKAVFTEESQQPQPPAQDVCEGGVGIAKAIAALQPEQAATMQAVTLTMMLTDKDKPPTAAQP